MFVCGWSASGFSHVASNIHVAWGAGGNRKNKVRTNKNVFVARTHVEDKVVIRFLLELAA